MKLPEFIISHIPEAGAIIIQSKQPYYYGRVILFNTTMEYTEWASQFRGLAFAQVINYRIAVAFESSLSGKAFVKYNFLKEVQTIVDNMAQLYLDQEIRPDQDKFKKYIY